MPLPLQPLATIVGRAWQSRPLLATVVTLFAGAALSAFMNNTPIVVLLLPILVGVSMRVKFPISDVMLPMGLATIVGGMSTTIGTSTNLLVVGISQDLGMHEFTMFEWVLPVAIVGGVAILFLASGQLAVIAWLETAPFWWVWGSVCLYMFTVAILMANAMVIALDPLPSIAGVASSIIGTIQNAVGAGGALLAASIYDGTVRNSILIIAAAGITVTLVFLMRPLIAPGDLVHHDENKLLRG